MAALAEEQVSAVIASRLGPLRIEGSRCLLAASLPDASFTSTVRAVRAHPSSSVASVRRPSLALASIRCLRPLLSTPVGGNSLSSTDRRWRLPGSETYEKLKDRFVEPLRGS